MEFHSLPIASCFWSSAAPVSLHHNCTQCTTRRMHIDGPCYVIKVLTPTSEASTTKMNWSFGFGICSFGKEDNVDRMVWKAASASGDQENFVWGGKHVQWGSNYAVVPDESMVEVCEAQLPQSEKWLIPQQYQTRSSGVVPAHQKTSDLSYNSVMGPV